MSAVATAAANHFQRQHVITSTESESVAGANSDDVEVWLFADLALAG